MDDRYSRQVLFRPIGMEGQEKINNKHILLVGCGALGSANAEALVRAGIGHLTIIDRDYVEFSNLQRQQLFTEEDARSSLPKVIAAKNKLTQINSTVHIDSHVMDATSNTLRPLLDNVDIVIDATDNFDTRFILNDLLQQLRIPWIFGACVGSTGMSFTVIPGETPCLNCLLPAIPLVGATCDAVGIIGPTVQMVVAHQTTEVLKLLVEDRETLRSNLVTFDLWHNQFQTIKMDRAKDPDCPTCGSNPSYPYLQYDKQTKTEILCGRDTVLIRNNREISLEDLAKHLEKVGDVSQNGFLLVLHYQSYRLVFFKDGRTFIHGTNSIELAKKIYYQLVG
ncbi:MoeB/ThiF family adenylyltransferase [Paraliobacillus sp. X-1268]|uniref:MoeB/ThiF family adenylyltransferase n=1 Tax=Paraliobacillus sp. X-1268 TaxID=2213193 RepID=UPI000E3D05FA|nr:MoeB/ThiF family adenylyltransferase [Paraliobacillus sp. X-1268]